MQAVEQDNRTKSLALSIAIHAVLLLLCFFATLSMPDQAMEGAGIILNYGTDEEGMGADAFSKDAPAIGDPAKLTPVFEKTNPTSQAVKDVVGKDYATQDQDEAPEVVTGKPNTKPTPTVTTPTEDVDPNPTKVNNDAIYKGKKNNGTGGGDGTGKTPGNQGSGDGDPNSGNYGTGTAGMGSGSGGGVALNLTGRKFLIKPNIRDDGQTQGKIVVEIKVDKNGTVIEANAGYRGTTLSNIGLWRKCEQSVLGAKLNSLATAPDLQIGTVVFNFDLQ